MISIGFLFFVWEEGYYLLVCFDLLWFVNVHKVCVKSNVFDARLHAYSKRYKTRGSYWCPLKLAKK